MNFHLAMLLATKLFVLPFENLHMKKIVRFEISAYIQVLFWIISNASICAMFLFATRREGTGGSLLIYVLTNSIGVMWMIGFLSFGLHAIRESKRKRILELFPQLTSAGMEQRRMIKKEIRKLPSSSAPSSVMSSRVIVNPDCGPLTNELESLPWWNNYVGTKSPFKIAGIYRFTHVCVLSLLPCVLFYGLFIDPIKRDDEGRNPVAWLGSALLPLHAGFGSLFGATDPRREGYPWREFFAFFLNPVMLVLFGIADIVHFGGSRPLYLVTYFSGAVLLLFVWPFCKKARDLVASLPNSVLREHMPNVVFKGAMAYLIPICK